MTLAGFRLTAVAGALALVAVGTYACSDRSETTAPSNQPECPRRRAGARPHRGVRGQGALYGPVAPDGRGGRNGGGGEQRRPRRRPGIPGEGRRAERAASLDGVGVETMVTGEISAVLPSARPGASAAGVDPRRACPSGADRRVERQLQGPSILPHVLHDGTLGVLKEANNKFYALSNNHVYAVENMGHGGYPIIQPGGQTAQIALDPCRQDRDGGRLHPAQVRQYRHEHRGCCRRAATTATVDNMTPKNGYGKPSSTIKTATLGRRREVRPDDGADAWCHRSRRHGHGELPQQLPGEVRAPDHHLEQERDLVQRPGRLGLADRAT